MDIFIAELIGTLILILLGDGAVANVLLKKSKGENSGWIVIATGWGFAVTMGVFAVGWISGGHINPAVTIGLAISGKTAWSLTPYYFSGQFCGAILGAILVFLTYKPHYDATDNKTFMLLTFCTKPAISRPFWNLVTEIIATAVLLFGVLTIFNKHNGLGNGTAPYAVGILVLCIGLSLGGPTGYAINPARDLGPRLVHAFLPLKKKGPSYWKYSWIPILGPVLGAVIGSYLYLLSIVNIH